MTYTAEEVATIYWATFATGPRHSIWNGVHWEPRATEPVAGTIVDAWRVMVHPCQRTSSATMRPPIAAPSTLTTSTAGRSSKRPRAC